MKVSKEGRKKISLYEGNELTAYKDQVGVWTIGVGHTAAAGLPEPRKGMTITAEESDQILSRDLVLFEGVVNKAVKVPLNQNQFDSLVSLALNIGGGAFSKSTLVKKVNAKDYAGAAEQFLVWNKAGGKVNDGLVNRRAKERKTFLTPSNEIAEEPVVAPVVEAPQKPVEAPVEVPATPLPKVKESLLVALLKALRSMFK